MQSRKTCCVCSQIDGWQDNDLISRLIGDTAYIRRVAMENDNFAVIPSLGPIVPGHSLLCPKAHVRSLAHLPDGLDTEFQQMKQKATDVLKSLFGAPIHYFEHGTGDHAEHSLCSTDHAHLHLIPAEVEVWSRLRHRFRWLAVSSTLGDLRARAQGAEYLFYESPENCCGVAPVDPSEVESQYLRRVFVQALGRDSDWNWKDAPAPMAAHETYRAIHAACQSDPVSE